MRRSEEIARIFDGFLAGESDAIAAVQGWILAVVRGANWRFEDPEGIVQEIQVVLWQKARSGRVREPGGFQKYVQTVARCLCIDAYHRRRRRGEVELSEVAEERLGTAEASPSDRLEARERLAALRYVLQRLSPQCRELWRLVYGERRSAAEVGRRLGITAGNVRVRVHRCLQQARAIYRDLEAAMTGGGQ